MSARVIVAIKLDRDDPSWYPGPVYAVAEEVFGKKDFGGCALEADAWTDGPMVEEAGE